MIAIRCTRAKAFHSTGSINQERKLGDRRRLDTVVVLTINDVNQGLDEIKKCADEETLFWNPSVSQLPCSELKEKSRVYGLQGEYGHKAET